MICLKRAAVFFVSLISLTYQNETSMIKTIIKCLAGYLLNQFVERNVFNLLQVF